MLSSNKSGETKKLLVLASGRGTNFEAIFRGIEQGRIQRAEIVGLICNRKEAPVLDLARHLGVPASLIPSEDIPKKSYEQALMSEMLRYSPDLVLLAGYMKILGKEIVNHFENRILNIHPSLLPAFKGLDAQKQALEAGVKETGCTVHWVTEGLDDGPIVEQSRIEIHPDDTVDSLSARLLLVENETYVAALRKVLGP